MVTVYHLTGYITETGELRIDLPKDHPIGAVKVTIESAAEEASPLTPEEIKEFLTFKPVPAHELVFGGWEDLDIGDSAAWVEELRRKGEERPRGW
jgi:hypothetical protein